MGFFDNFNPLDPAGLMPGGSNSPMGGGGGGGEAGGSSVNILGVTDPNAQKDEGPLDVQKAYGFSSPSTDSQFNQMRKQQMGMGGPSQGG